MRYTVRYSSLQRGAKESFLVTQSLQKKAKKFQVPEVDDVSDAM
jgi:hypothetical protein